MSDGVVFPVTLSYTMWEIALAGSDMETACKTVGKEDRPGAGDFMKEFETFFSNFNAKR